MPITDPAFAKRPREQFRRRHPRRVRRGRIGKLVGVIEVNRTRDVAGRILLRPGRRRKVGRPMRAAPRIDDAQRRIVRVRLYPIDFNKRFNHRYTAASRDMSGSRMSRAPCRTRSTSTLVPRWR